MLTRSLREIQATLPWDLHDYSPEFLADTRPQRDALHALLHITKARGQIAARLLRNPDQPDRFLADLIYCALRIGNVWPGRKVWIDEAMRAHDEPLPRDVATALLRLDEAAGHLAKLLDQCDHGTAPEYQPDAALADLVDVATVLGTLWPGRCIDVRAALEARCAQKHVGASMVAPDAAVAPAEPETIAPVNLDALLAFAKKCEGETAAWPAWKLAAVREVVGATPDDADDKVVAKAAPGVRWECYRNVTLDGFTSFATWPCGYINPAGTLQCQGCGQERTMGLGRDLLSNVGGRG